MQNVATHEHPLLSTNMWLKTLKKGFLSCVDLVLETGEETAGTLLLFLFR